MEEKNKTDMYTYYTKTRTDTNDCKTLEIPARVTNEKEIIARRSEEKRQQDIQVVCENDTVVCRSNSVSKMTQHFKALQEKAKVAVAIENSSRNIIPRKSSHAQRYRKTQDGERFNTQPVTFQEVHEAVLQNQRNAAVSSTAETPDDELEPSKLSLAERVQLFDQKIAETVVTNTTSQERPSQRRRSFIRYKTQPVTSEEVEVAASRILSLNINHQFQALTGGNF